jgi:hypothetical protein
MIQQNKKHLGSLPRSGAITGNVSFAATVVAGLVAGRFLAVGRDVSHLATIETAAVLRSGLVDDVPVVPFQTRIGALARNVATFATVVAGLFATRSSGRGTTTSTAATKAAALLLGFFFCSFRRHTDISFRLTT